MHLISEHNGGTYESNWHWLPPVGTFHCLFQGTLNEWSITRRAAILPPQILRHIIRRNTPCNGWQMQPTQNVIRILSASLTSSYKGSRRREPFPVAGTRSLKETLPATVSRKSSNEPHPLTLKKEELGFNLKQCTISNFYIFSRFKWTLCSRWIWWSEHEVYRPTFVRLWGYGFLSSTLGLSQ